VGEGEEGLALKRAVYGPDDQCLQPGWCPIVFIESRHTLNIAATGVTGFMTQRGYTTAVLSST
jgi:hypothetical protein